MKKIGFTIAMSLFFIAGVVMIFNMPKKEQISAQTYKDQILNQMSQLKEVKLSEDVVLTQEDFQLNELTDLSFQTTNMNYMLQASSTITYLTDLNELVMVLVRGNQGETKEQDESSNQPEYDVEASIQALSKHAYLSEKPTFKQGEKLYNKATTLNQQLQTYKELTFKADNKTKKEKTKQQESLQDALAQYTQLLDTFFNDYYPSLYETIASIGYDGVKPVPVDKETLKLNLINYISISDRYFVQTQDFLGDVLAYFELFNIMKEYEELVVLTGGTGHFAFSKDVEQLNKKSESVEHLNTSLSYEVQVKAERLSKTALTFNPILVEKLVLADVELKQYYLTLNAAQGSQEDSTLDEQLGKQFMILHGLMQSIYKDLQDVDAKIFYDMSQQIVAVSSEM